MGKPSDVLPPPESGDANGDIIYMQVGYALSMWEDFENEVADMFALLTGGPPGRATTAAKRAYGTIQSFRGRQDMVISAARVVLEKTEERLLHDIKRFLDEAGAFSARRNEIAHGQVKKIEINIPQYVNDTTYYLVPALYNSRKTDILEQNINVNAYGGESDIEAIVRHFKPMLKKGFGSYKYNSEQVRYYALQFVNLKSRIAELNERLAAALQS